MKNDIPLFAALLCFTVALSGQPYQLLSPQPEYLVFSNPGASFTPEVEKNRQLLSFGAQLDGNKEMPVSVFGGHHLTINPLSDDQFLLSASGAASFFNYSPMTNWNVSFAFGANRRIRAEKSNNKQKITKIFGLGFLANISSFNIRINKLRPWHPLDPLLQLNEDHQSYTPHLGASLNMGAYLDNGEQRYQSLVLSYVLSFPIACRENRCVNFTSPYGTVSFFDFTGSKSYLKRRNQTFRLNLGISISGAPTLELVLQAHQIASFWTFESLARLKFPIDPLDPFTFGLKYSKEKVWGLEVSFPYPKQLKTVLSFNIFPLNPLLGNSLDAMLVRQSINGRQ